MRRLDTSVTTVLQTCRMRTHGRSRVRKPLWFMECEVDVWSSDHPTKQLGLPAEGKGSSCRLCLYRLYLTNGFMAFSGALERLLSSTPMIPLAREGCNG